MADGISEGLDNPFDSNFYTPFATPDPVYYPDFPTNEYPANNLPESAWDKALSIGGKILGAVEDAAVNKVVTPVFGKDSAQGPNYNPNVYRPTTQPTAVQNAIPAGTRARSGFSMNPFSGIPSWILYPAVAMFILIFAAVLRK